MRGNTAAEERRALDGRSPLRELERVGQARVECQPWIKVGLGQEYVANKMTKNAIKRTKSNAKLVKIFTQLVASVVKRSGFGKECDGPEDIVAGCVEDLEIGVDHGGKERDGMRM